MDHPRRGPHRCLRLGRPRVRPGVGVRPGLPAGHRRPDREGPQRTGPLLGSGSTRLPHRQRLRVSRPRCPGPGGGRSGRRSLPGSATWSAGMSRATTVRVVEATSEGALPEWCAGAEWMRPIDELDLYAYLGDMALLASGRNLVQLLGRAEAPGPDGPAPPSPPEAMGGPQAASNGWAVGGDVTASGHGMVLANPHFPWYGEARFWECHLTNPRRDRCVRRFVDRHAVRADRLQRRRRVVSHILVGPPVHAVSPRPRPRYPNQLPVR